MKVRSKDRLDYKILNETGREVLKEGGKAEMGSKEIEELKILEDINHTLNLYDLNDLGTEDEVNEGVVLVSNLSKTYRHLLVEIKISNEEIYDKNLLKYRVHCDKMDNYIKNARTKLREIRKNEVKGKEMTKDIEKSNQMESLKIEFFVLKKKVALENDAVDVFTATNGSEIDRYVSKMEQFIENLFDLSGKMEKTCPVVYRKNFEEELSNFTIEIRQDIQMAKILKQKLCSHGEKLLNKAIVSAERIKQETKAENLLNELQIRYKSLSKKLDVDLENLSDYQILDIQKNKSLDLEFNEILEKVTEISFLAPTSGGKFVKMIEKVNKARDRLVLKKDNFSDALCKIVLTRDITPEKMKQASELAIDLPKFTGYDGKLDFFTFRTEFKKLVEPKVQKKFWPDYLKRNYLGGQALNLVEKETDYEKIWERLKDSFGSTKFLLQNKVNSLNKMGGLFTVRSDQKLVNALTKLVNTMQDLSVLASEHDLEGQLYEGGGLEIIMCLLGDKRHRKFRSQNLNTDFSKKQEWEKLREFLNRELKLTEKMLIDQKNVELMGMSLIKSNSDKKSDYDSRSASNVLAVNKNSCHICGKDNHTTITTKKGHVIVPYYVCEKFVKWSAAEKLKELTSKNLCTICLYPGSKKGPSHKCIFTNFSCPSHEKKDNIHVLLCDKHKEDGANLKLLQKFKERFIENCPVQLPDFANSLSLFSGTVDVGDGVQTEISFGLPKEIPDIKERAIFMRQTIKVGKISLTLLFDNGCGQLIVKKSVVDKLKKLGRAVQTVKGPLHITGVGDNQTISENGEFAICLPLHSGENAVLTGVCLPKVTGDFPKYKLSDVEKDIRIKCNRIGGDELVSRLPRLASLIKGGDVDLLIGSKYLRYFPECIYKFKSGLGIYESVFKSEDGTRGVLNGPHEFFEKCAKDNAHIAGIRAYWVIGNEMPLLGDKECFVSNDIGTPIDSNHSQCCSGCFCAKVFAGKKAPKNAKRFEEIENAGSEVTYRCVDCRSCKNCKNGPRVEAISIQEELEQNLIEKCVEVDIERAKTVAKLPFIMDPLTHLEPSNEHVALRVFKAQVKLLNANPKDKKSVLDFEQKLQDLGYVDYFENLNGEERAIIEKNSVKYFIPWRPVWKLDSVSTPCRLAFDASMSTKGACSLNSLLAKGANTLNNLQGITIRWTTYRHAFHTDVQKMYNRVELDKMHWCYQMYLFNKDLNVDAIPKWKIIKTVIYGVRPSGGLAVCGLRRTVLKGKDKYPHAYHPIMDDTYMDDCASGTESPEKSFKVMDEIQVAIGQGGFDLKGFSMSGRSPPEHLTQDGESVTVLGLKWFPKGDFFKLNVGEQNFSQKLRGKKRKDTAGIISDKLTLRDCVSRASEIFDPLGRVAPIIAGIKLDISLLHKRCVGWDDPIPSELKEIWVKNFETINDLANAQFQRAVVPPDAVNLEVETIDAADAGENLVCAAIYARFLRRDGSYSCQLIFARTKVIHDHTIPRAELVAAVLNASTGHIVRSSLREHHKRSWHITDSQVALHIINCFKAALKTWSRNRVVEITRLTNLSDWFYVSRDNMIADIGTRKGAKIDQVNPESQWVRGMTWMRENPERFPFSTVEDILLSSNETNDATKEKVMGENEKVLLSHTALTHVHEAVEQRYRFSNYLLNPSKFRFKTVVRIMGLVLLFIKKICEKIKRKFELCETENSRTNEQYVVFPVLAATKNEIVSVAVIHIPQNILTAAKNYYFRRAALEIQEFVNPNQYKKISTWRNKILYYTGRILMTQKIDGKSSFTDAMLDLSESNFCVPMTDFHSPIAYAIVSETHWYDPDISHKGVESTLRYAQNTAYILGGRDLVKRIKKACTKCRILHMKGVEVAMGPVANENLKIAPAFFNSQVDLSGPFSAYSPANKRATLKIWIVVFVCTVTSAVDCRIMENYDTESFILAFTRFSCRFGYPKLVMPDEGSQLMRGCKDMVLSFSDISNKLSTEYGVEFKTCPVGAHYVHGKVERKIQQIKGSIERTLKNDRISILQWETIIQQISNSINNLPIGLGNKTDSLENLDILTPNRLLLGRNNSRNPTLPLEVSGDFRKIIDSNVTIYEKWFKEWIVSYVPLLVQQPKWFLSDRSGTEGDVVIFKKSDKEFEKYYQYGIISKTFEGRDGLIRTVEVEYQNSNENIKRVTKRGVREITVIHPVDELGISAELNEFAKTAKNL